MGCHRSHPQAISTAIQRRRRLPALLIPCSRRLSPLSYGVGVNPARLASSRRFLICRQPKNSRTNSVALDRPDRLEVEQQPQLLDIDRLVVAEGAAPGILQAAGLAVRPNSSALELAEDAGTQLGRDRPPVPLTKLAEAFRQLVIDYDVKAEVGEQSLDAIGVLVALVLDGDQLAVGLAAVLVLGGGDADDAPELVLAAVIADQHGQELGDVQAIALVRRARRLTSMLAALTTTFVTAWCSR